MSGNSSLYQYNAVAQALSKKWGWMVKGIQNEQVRMNTAVLLENENQRGGLLTEDTTSGQTSTALGFPQPGSDGATTGADIAPFQHYLLPLVRRVYPNLIANELVGVQPMTSPASLVFYLKYKYTGLVNPDYVGAAPGNVTQQPYAKGQTAPGTEYGNFSGNTWAIDPYYSLQTVFRETGSAAVLSGALTAGAVAGGVVTYTNAAGITTASYVVAPIANTTTLYSSTFTATVTEGAGPTNDTATIVVTASGATVSFANAGTIGAVTASTFNTATGAYTVTLNVSDVAGTGLAMTATSAITKGATVYSYDYNMEGNRTLPEMELQVDSNPVAAKTRKLRTKWTIESAQDLRAMHNIDAEQELIAVLANEVTAEIDREILNDLLVNAAIRVDYDYSSPFIVGGIAGAASTGTLGGVAGTYIPGVSGLAVSGVSNYDDRNKALFYQILETRAQIYRQSLRGSGNWVVTSPEVGAKLESLSEFKPDASTDATMNMAVQYVGTLQGAIKVYKDPLFPRDMILVGYKGSSFMDAGYFYCPYVPLQLTPTVLDDESFNPRKGLITRYGKVMVENGNRMYARIKVYNMGAIGSNGLPSFTGVSPDPQKNSNVLMAAVASSTLI